MSESSKETPFTKVTQVGIVVRDAEQTAERLTALGIGPFEPKVLPPERKEWFRGEPMEADFKIMAAMIGDIEIELIQPVSGDSPHKEFLETKGEGIQHIACAVEDLDETVERLTAQGVTELLKARFPGGRKATYLDLGTANFIIELLERNPWQPTEGRS